MPTLFKCGGAYMYTIGERIRFFRGSRFMTQADLARESGIHPVSIRRYETNKMSPYDEQISKLAKVLDVSTVALAGIPTEPIYTGTDGSFVSLLMVMHQTGLLTMRGERGDDNKIKVETLSFCWADYFKNRFKVCHNQRGSQELVPLESMQIKLPDEILDQLLSWEKALYIYNSYIDEHKEPLSEEEKTTIDEMRTTLDEIEMVVQASTSRDGVKNN